MQPISNAPLRYFIAFATDESNAEIRRAKSLSYLIAFVDNNKYFVVTNFNKLGLMLMRYIIYTTIKNFNF
jgi:hypothetical protein